MDDSAEVPLILQGNEKLLFEQEVEQDELPFPLPIQVIPSSEFFIWVNRTTSDFFLLRFKDIAKRTSTDPGVDFCNQINTSLKCSLLFETSMRYVWVVEQIKMVEKVNVTFPS